MLRDVLVPLVLLLNGLGAGVLVGTLLGGVPLLLALPDDRYVEAHAFFATRFDPFMPVCLVGTLIGDVALTVLVGGAAGPLFAVAAAAVLAAMVVSLAKNVPINRYVRGLNPATLPPDFAEHDPRMAWRTWNRLRAVLVVIALLVNCAALTVLL